MTNKDLSFLVPPISRRFHVMKDGARALWTDLGDSSHKTALISAGERRYELSLPWRGKLSMSDQ